MPAQAKRHTRTALCLAALLMLGCGDNATEPQTGSILARLTISGSQPDSDGSRVTVDGSTTWVLLDGESHVFEGLSTGTHSVTISDVAFNCIVQGDVSRSVVVGSDQPALVPFVVDCPAPGAIEVGAPTAGSTTDPDGYTVVLDGVTTRSIGVNGVETFADLAVGQHDVELLDVADNCSVTGDNPRLVTVEEGVTTRVDLSVDHEVVEMDPIEELFRLRHVPVEISMQRRQVLVQLGLPPLKIDQILLQLGELVVELHDDGLIIDHELFTASDHRHRFERLKGPLEFIHLGRIGGLPGQMGLDQMQTHLARVLHQLIEFLQRLHRLLLSVDVGAWLGAEDRPPVLRENLIRLRLLSP